MLENKKLLYLVAFGLFVLAIGGFNIFSTDESFTSSFDFGFLNGRNALAWGFIISMVLVAVYVAYVLLPKIAQSLSDIFVQKKSSEPLQRYLQGVQGAFEVPKGFENDDKVNAAIKHLTENFPFYGKKDKKEPNYAIGVLKKDGEIVRQYLASSRSFKGDYAKQYKTYLDALNGWDDEKILCMCTENPSNGYYFPPAILNEQLEFEYVCDDEKEATMYENRGFKATIVNSDFVNMSHDLKKSACTEKRILHQIYSELELLGDLKEYDLHIHTELSPCASCIALLKLQNEKDKEIFKSLTVSYDAAVYKYDEEALSDVDAELIKKIKSKIQAA